MSFFDDLKALPPVQPFQGGNDNQRNHLNELVDNQNAMIDSAKRHFENNAGTLGLWINLAGERVFVTLQLG